MAIVYFFDRYNPQTNRIERQPRPGTLALIEKHGQPVADTAREVPDDLVDLDGWLKDCRCGDARHAEHEGRSCRSYATESDGLCKTCHDHEAERRALRVGGPPTTPAGGDVIIEAHRIPGSEDLDWSVRVAGGATLRMGTKDGEATARYATSEAARSGVDCWFFPPNGKPFELVANARGRAQRLCTVCGTPVVHRIGGTLVRENLPARLGPEVWACPDEHEEWWWLRDEQRWRRPR